MNHTEHLLDILSEKASEVAQAVSKALRVGLWEKMSLPPEHSEIANAERIANELGDLLGMVDWLVEEGALPPPSEERRRTKRQRVEMWLEHSCRCGTLTQPTSSPDATFPAGSDVGRYGRRMTRLLEAGEHSSNGGSPE